MSYRVFGGVGWGAIEEGMVSTKGDKEEPDDGNGICAMI